MEKQNGPRAVTAAGTPPGATAAHFKIDRDHSLSNRRLIGVIPVRAETLLILGLRGLIQ